MTPSTSQVVLGKDLLANGADRDRTGDPLLAKQVLSQLSYRPEVYLLLKLTLLR